VESAAAEVVLIVGSFPPLPTPAASATVAAVRRELGSGRIVVTASPRASAAAHVLPVTGPLGAWRLEQARRRFAATNLILSVEPGWPLPPGTFAVLRRFARATLLVSEPTPAVLGVVRRLRHAAAEVVLGHESSGPEAVAALAFAAPGLPLRVEHYASLGRPVTGVTPLGPPEPSTSQPARRMLGPGVRFARRVARRVARRAVDEVRTRAAR
jgi:hypothetical protein